jgi:hypothetical protein
MTLVKGAKRGHPMESAGRIHVHVCKKSCMIYMDDDIGGDDECDENEEEDEIDEDKCIYHRKSCSLWADTV